MPKINLKSFSLDAIDTPRARQVIYILGIVILVGIAFLKVKPNLDQEKSLQAATVQVQAEQQQKEKELQTLQASKSSKGNRAQELSKVILTSLPTDVQNDGILGDLNSLANYTGVSLGSFQPTIPADGGSFRKVAVSLSLSGTYENCLRFMNGLTSQTVVNTKRATISAVGPIWSIESVSLAPGGTATSTDPNAKPDPDQTTMTLTTTLYLSPLTTTAPATGATAAPSGTPQTATPAPTTP